MYHGPYHHGSKSVEGNDLDLSLWSSLRSLSHCDSGSKNGAAAYYNAQHSYQWTHSVTPLIEKDEGLPFLTWLWVIHLFEADYNLFLKLIFGRRMKKC